MKIGVTDMLSACAGNHLCARSCGNLVLSLISMLLFFAVFSKLRSVMQRTRFDVKKNNKTCDLTSDRTLRLVSFENAGMCRSDIYNALR